MGMPCEVNSILKLKPSQGYPAELTKGVQYQAVKEDYRIIPIDTPILLVDQNWMAYADIIICKLIWQNNQTTVMFEIDRIYNHPFPVK
ncbi:hypothetical protein Cylst_3134 [Cylindrospermum stagnale PCC 7417]|uniref:DUF2584 domain-containing protein n=1 Tax=Cylindrospermum stagnale PCC 7417 TaxID=56107 RepID=K9WY56_9NOST|nr:DUF2584 family protein [Cylindrospermum stagnale]AFZ25300.1 hypothetical protein Cylst_3134 [Cylindrospermum stagnale PCC 7417]